MRPILCSMPVSSKLGKHASLLPVPPFFPILSASLRLGES